jgi:hypothetical protein
MLLNRLFQFSVEAEILRHLLHRGERGGQLDEKTTGRPDIQLSKERMKQIEGDFDPQTRRLNDFIAVATAKIEELRLRTKDNRFLRHQFCFFCGD